MTVRPYDASYLQEVVETQGSLFECLQDESPHLDGIDFVRNYMAGSTRAYLDKGDAYLATMSPKDLMAYYLESERPSCKSGEPLKGFMPNWLGQFYAQYQWQTGIPSREIVERIKPEWLAVAYSGLHDLDLSLAVEKVALNVEMGLGSQDRVFRPRGRSSRSTPRTCDNPLPSV